MSITAIPAPTPFAGDTVRCWRIALDAPAPDAAATARLCAHEHERARRFVFERDRLRYLHAHVALHRLLAQALGRSDDTTRPLPLAQRPSGKPWLPTAPRLRFNLSHSGDTAVVAISTAAEVGVDVELPRPVPEALALARAHGTPAEQQALAALPAAAREQAFLQLWTRKEACLKALGTGLALDPNLLDVGLSGDTPPRWRPPTADRPAGPLALGSCVLPDGLHFALALHRPAPAPAPASVPEPASMGQRA